MRGAKIHLIVLSVAFCACGSQSETPTEPTPEPQVASSSTMENAATPNTEAESDTAAKPAQAGSFAFNLYQALRESKGNLLFSPLSLELAFGMTWAGANGQTASEMAEALGIDEPAQAYHAHNADKLAKWNKKLDEANKLRVVNRLYGHTDYEFEPQFIALMRDAYKAPLEPTDFAKADAARTKINKWVEKQTEERIKDLLPPNGIDDLTRLVLVNAIYFLGEWTTPFNKNASKPEDFELASGDKVKVQMMNQTEVHRYAEVDNVQVLELPYRGKELAMTILLPKSAAAMTDLEEVLNRENFDKWTAALASQKVKVAFPKFEVDNATFDVPQVMKSLGMKLAFDRNKADFTAMANPDKPDDQLYISAAFHKAFIKVDEKGSEAAAATAVVMATRGAAPRPQPVPTFRADHPFVYAIRDVQTGRVLFLGRLSDPRP